MQQQDVDVDGMREQGVALFAHRLIHVTLQNKITFAQKIHFGFRFLVFVPENHIQCLDVANIDAIYF